MMRKRDLRLGCVLAAMALGSMSVSAIAGGGGRSGGDSGDSSMNPFTGDSYAYFHGGHNLGEEGMIIPGRTPPRAPIRKQQGAKAPDENAPSVSDSATGPRDERRPAAQRSDAR